MAIGNTYRLTAVWSGPQGQDIVNQFTLKQTTGFVVGFADPAEALIDAWINDVQTDYAGAVNAACQIVSYRASNIDGAPEVAELILSTPVSGGIGGECNAPQVAAEVLWKTGIPGRRNRGRTFMPPGSETYSNGGVWLSTYETAIANFAAALLSFGNAVTNGGWRHVVWSGVALAARDRTAYRLWPYARTIGRRAFGIGS